MTKVTDSRPKNHLHHIIAMHSKNEYPVMECAGSFPPQAVLCARLGVGRFGTSQTCQNRRETGV